jgi:hypothetical protein
MTIKKRGRPVGIKNKTKSFEETLLDWDNEEAKIDLKDLCQKLQNALAKSYVDFQELEKDMKYFTQNTDVLEAQLEIKQMHIERLELQLAHRVAKEEGIFRDEE